MRRMLALLLAVLLLTGCSGPVQQESANTGIHVGICLQGAEPAINYQLLAQQMKQLGWQVSVVDAGQDQTVQNHQIKDFAAQELSLLIVEPVMWDGADLLVEQLRATNMPAVFVGHTAQTQALSSWDRVCYVGSTASSPASAQVQLLLNSEQGDINGDGNICYGVLAGEEALQTTQEQLDVYAQTLPQGVLLETMYSTLEREEGKLLCSRLLSRFGPDLEVVLCHSDQLALGALEALVEAGRVVGTDVLLVGSGGAPEALEAIRDGKLVGSVRSPDQQICDTVLTAAQKLLADTAVESVYLLDWIPIDRHQAAVLLAA